MSLALLLFRTRSNSPNSNRDMKPNRHLKSHRDMNTSNSLKTVLAGLALIASVHLASAQTIPASLAAPPGSVNTNILGMKMHIIQGNIGLLLTAAAPAERLITGRAIDPATGLPFENVA